MGEFVGDFGVGQAAEVLLLGWLHEFVAVVVLRGLRGELVLLSRFSLPILPL